MTRGDKAALRLTTGLGWLCFVAYGLGCRLPSWSASWPAGAVQAGPLAADAKAVVIAGCLPASAGVLMVPLLEHTPPPACC
jgi:hypothetical protein